MTEASDLASGKGHNDENFPVASFLLRPDARAPVMAFYRFARVADDISDNEDASPETKLTLLGQMRAGLDGEGAPEAMALREVMAARGLDPAHARDLLDAFIRDVTVTRYAEWDDLIGYCRLSAMPVGRFVLDVHGEPRHRPANDALCAALQIINHLQDCAKDYRALDRVYIPLDTGVNIPDLGGDRASPELRAILTGLVERTRGLLAQSAGFSALIRDRRLAAEVAVIQRLAESLCDRLEARDPLSERVHHSKVETALLALGAAVPPAAAARGMSEAPVTAEATQAAGSSFYAGMRMLPKAEREAMYAVYGFCRLVDDIADDQQGDRASRAAALDQWRHDLDALYAGRDPGQAALVAEAVKRFDLDRADFEAVIDGMAMDVARDIRWPSMDELDLYCDRVASAVGRLSVRIFGMEREPGIALAHHLGRALQLTNILRDIDEDAEIGRVYLAAEVLTGAGIALTTPEEVVADPCIDQAVRPLVARAHDHYRAANAILAARPKGHLIAPRLMEAAYSRLLKRMETVGWAPPRTRVRTNKLALIATLLWLLVTR